MKKISLLLGLVFALQTAASAQTTIEPTLDKLENQFSQLKSKSNNYREHNREFKVVDVNQLNIFWSGVLNIFKTHEKELLNSGKNSIEELQKANTTIAAQASQIEALKKDNELKDAAAKQNAYEIDNILVAGIGINKNLFLILSLGIIAGLLVLSAVIMSMYKKGKKITDEKINAFKDIDHEFSEFKKAARERELKIKRELQTEMNSKAEMKQQLALLQK